MYDISTSQETQITTTGTAYYPAIYGNKIVWYDGRNGNNDIYMYDLSTLQETQITTNESDQMSPVIYGNRIAWRDYRNGKSDVYVYDLSTHQETHTTSKLYHYDPAIYGDRIVWQGSSNEYSNGDTYVGTLSYLPIAAFVASPTNGKHPLNVKFIDKSTGSPTSWSWNFGDKTTSAAQNPTHKYTKAGKYTVKLTVKNAVGSNSKTMTITVK
jgi:beta propeller repeat protein